MYETIEDFKDLVTGKVYRKGDAFPGSNSYPVPAERLEELSSDKNPRKTPLIKLIGKPVEKEKKPVAKKTAKKK